ncbi:unnamed protein product, partial [Prorocentrum cordatum]
PFWHEAGIAAFNRPPLNAWPSMAKGKGKDASRQGHTLPRTRVTAEKFTGVVVAWKGKFGWIKPDEEVEHEKASMRTGHRAGRPRQLLCVQRGAELRAQICSLTCKVGSPICSWVFT